MNKIYTFEFQYIINGFKSDETQFCAYSKDEATDLFWNFVREEYGSERSIDIHDVNVVYNEDDAFEYDLEYGTPEEYEVESA